MKSHRLLASLFIFACGAVLMSGAAGSSGEQPTTYVSNSRMTSKFLAADFRPVGDLGNPAWQKVAWEKFDRQAFSDITYPEATTEIASLWTDDSIYFGYRCKYTTLNTFEGKDPTKDFWTLWERDVVEVFLNPQPERMMHYYEFEVAPNNLWIDLEINLGDKPFNDPKWDSGFEHATHVDAAKHIWTCEMRIPLSPMNAANSIKPGAEWRLNFFRADGPGEKDQRRLLSWSPVQSDSHNFHSPWSFGVVRFVK